MIKLFSIVLLIGSLVSCSKKMLPPAETKIVIKDSIIEREKILWRDTTIVLAGDTTEITIPCPDQQINEYAGNGRIQLRAKSDGKGNVKINCQTDSLVKVISGLKTIIQEKEKYHANTTVQKIPYPVEVVKYKTPKWCWWLLIIAIAEAIWIFRKPIIGLIKKAFGVWI